MGMSDIVKGGIDEVTQSVLTEGQKIDAHLTKVCTTVMVEMGIRVDLEQVCGYLLEGVKNLIQNERLSVLLTS